MPRIAVVGGGIAGLAAALRLRDRLPQAQISVYESTARLGGKLRSGTLAGVPVETGAEAFLVRDPAGESAAVAMARRVGLAGALTHPEPVPPGLFVDGVMHRLPGGTLLGVPSDLSQVEDVAKPAAELDRDGGWPLLADGEDVAVGALVRARLGDEVADRLVDPMLGGVYAGRADALSLEATMPALAEQCRQRSTLVAAVRAALRPADGPVFATIHGGLSRLVDGMAAALGPVVRLATPVRSLDRAGGGWRVAGAEVDAVILALPGRPAARLLGVEPLLDYASVGLVTLVLPPVDLPELSGFLVPATEGFGIKAVTFFARKWRHVEAPVVRASLGRYGEPDVLQRTDADLVALVRSELAALLGGPLPEPAATLVTRWGGALPQYPPGHVARVAALRAALPRSVAVAGAGYDGVGIPACLKSGAAAADRIVEEFDT